MAVTPVKTIQTLSAWADITAGNAPTFSSWIDVSTKWSGLALISIGRRTGTAFTAGSPNIRIETSKKSSPDNASGIVVASYQPGLGTSIVNTTLNGAVSASDATFVVTSGSNIAAGDLIFLGHSSTSNYEIVRVKGVSGTTITPEAAVVFAHANSALVTDQAEMAAIPLDLKEHLQIRSVIDNISSGQNISAEVILITFDSM
jgi:hypothetical protein